jgi:acetyl-CoA carboxylase biotin carboxyl carrier protein
MSGEDNAGASDPAVQRPDAPAGLGALDALCRQAADLLAVTASRPASLIRLRVGDVSVELAWRPAPDRSPAAAPAAGPAVPPARPGPAADGGTEPEPGPPRLLVRAPTVGVFYRAAEPGAPPFVEVGDVVQADQQIGVLEAMKLMSRINAEHAGRVVEILAANGDPVEFDQPLLALEPA